MSMSMSLTPLVSSLEEIAETNSSSVSRTSTGGLRPADVTSTSSVSEDVIVTGSHTFTFNLCPQSEGFGVGKYLTSDTFPAGGNDWAIILYPHGETEEYKDYISLYIRLKSGKNVSALFVLKLVDQSGKGKHKIETNSGRFPVKQPFLMSGFGSQWGFGRYMGREYLKQSGFLKDDCLVVNCVVGVLAWLNVPSPVKLPHLGSATEVITNFESPLQLRGLINDGDRNDFVQYLYAVDDIQQSIKLGKFPGYETQETCAMKTLQQVFKGILECSTSVSKSDALGATVYSSSITSSYGYELQGSNYAAHGELSSEQVYRLRSIVHRMNSTECTDNCIEVYRFLRKSAVEARLLKFNIGNWTINDLQSLDCEEFAAKIRLWILAAHKCYNSIFPGERRYYEQIFDGVRTTVTYDNCFLAIVKNAAVELNNFADAASSVASFQKLFAVLNLYKILSIILPEIQNTFHSIPFAYISHGASNTTKRLATLVRILLSSFEDTVLNEQLNIPPPKVSIHSLTEYAMRYVTSISLHKELLANIIVSRPTKSLGNRADEQFLEATSGTPLRLHVIWIMMSLKNNLEGKSSFYEDTSLRYVFIMNNLNYIVKTIEGSLELREMIGEEYLSKLRKYVLRVAQEYFSTIWQRVLYCLRDDGLNYKFKFYNVISKNSLKKRVKTFNTTFEDVCETQSARFVPDTYLRGQLHKLISNKLLPAYKSFVEKFGSHTQTERYKERYVKFSSEDLQNKIQNLFLEP